MAEKGTSGEDPEKPSGDPTTRFEQDVAKDIDRIRETAKWLVTTFGAVAGVLLAGLSLSHLGAVEDGKLPLALAGAVMAVVGVTVAIAAASRVLVGGRVNLDTLREPTGSRLRDILPSHRARLRAEMASYKQLYGPFETLDGLLGESDRHWRDQVKAFQDWHAATDEGQRDDAMNRHKSADSGTAGLNPFLRRIRALANYQDMRLRFELASRWIIAGALLTAVGAGAFALTVGAKDAAKPAAATPAVPATPVAATLRPVAKGEERLHAVFGEHCELNRLRVIALASDDEGWEVVTDPAKAPKGCNVARTTVRRSEGTVVPHVRVLAREP
jgi:hypothetical protein